MRFDSPSNFGPAHFATTGPELDFDDIDAVAQPQPTEGQMKFIGDLREAWQLAELELSVLKNRAPRCPAWVDPASREEASAMIDNGKNARDAIRAELTEARRASRLAARERVGAVEPGLYVIGDDISTAYVYKVQQNRETGAAYVKVLDESGWQYVGRKPLYNIANKGHAMTADEAAWLGKDGASPIAGTCVNCSRDLTDETSLHYGYGETCAGHCGWPYIKGAERA